MKKSVLAIATFLFLSSEAFAVDVTKPETLVGDWYGKGLLRGISKYEAYLTVGYKDGELVYMFWLGGDKAPALGKIERYSSDASKLVGARFPMSDQSVCIMNSSLSTPIKRVIWMHACGYPERADATYLSRQ